jgi:hypothetical protein
MKFATVVSSSSKPIQALRVGCLMKKSMVDIILFKVEDILIPHKET